MAGEWLREIRRDNPQYSNLSDREVMDKVKQYDYPDWSDTDFINAVKKQDNYLRDNPAEDVDTGSFFGGVGSGIERMSRIPTAIGAAAGSQEALEEIQKAQAAEAEEAAPKMTLDDVSRQFGEGQYGKAAGTFAFDVLPEALGESVPDMAAMGAGAAAGAAAGSVIPGIGTGIGAVVGGIAGGIPSFFGSNVERQIAEGVDKAEDIDVTSALGAAGGQSTLEAATYLALSRIPGLKGLAKPVVDQMVSKGVRQLSSKEGAKILGNAALVGAGTGAGTEAGQQYLERLQAGLNTGDAEAISEYIESAILGGTLNLGLGAGFGVAGARGTVREANRRLDEVDAHAARRDAAQQEMQRKYDEAYAAGTPDPNILLLEAPKPREEVVGKYDPVEGTREDARTDMVEALLAENNTPEVFDNIQAQEAVDEALSGATKGYSKAQQRAMEIAQLAKETLSTERFKLNELPKRMENFVTRRLINQPMREGQDINIFEQEFSIPELEAMGADPKDIQTLREKAYPAQTDMEVEPSDVLDVANERNIKTDGKSFDALVKYVTGADSLYDTDYEQRALLRNTLHRMDKLPGQEPQNVFNVREQNYDYDTYRDLEARVIREGQAPSLKQITEDYGIPRAIAKEVIRDMQTNGLLVQRGNKYEATIKPRVGPTATEIMPEPTVREFTVQESQTPDGETKYTVVGTDLNAPDIVLPEAIQTFDTQEEADVAVEMFNTEQEASPQTTQQFRSISPEVIQTKVDEIRNARLTDLSETLTPDVIEDINNNIAAVMKRRGLKEAGVVAQVVNDVRDALNLPIEQGARAEGAYHRPAKMLYLDLKVASENIPDGTSEADRTEIIKQRLSEVLDHETIHALRANGFISNEDFNVLRKFVNKRQRPGKTATYMDEARTNYKEQAKALRENGATEEYINDYLTEEAVAEAFRDWNKNKKNVVGKPATIFQKIINGLKSLASVLNMSGIKNTDDIFRQLDEGPLTTDPVIQEAVDDIINPSQESVPEGVEILYSKTDPKDIPDTWIQQVRDKDVTFNNKFVSFLKRQFAPGGNLPRQVFDAKIFRDSKFMHGEREAQMLTADLERAVKTAFGRRWHSLPESTKQQINNALNGDMDAFNSLPQSVQMPVTAMRSHLDRLSDMYADTLRQEIQQLQENNGHPNSILAKQQLLETIEANRGKYVHRSYKVFDDPNWNQKVPEQVLRDAMDYILSKNGNNFEDAKRIINVILKNNTAYDDMSGMIAEGKLGSKDLTILKRRKDIAEPIRKLMGENTDVRLNYTRSAVMMNRMIFNHQFLQKVLELGDGNFLFKEGEAPANATAQIAGEQSKLMDPLNGLWTTPEIKQAFIDAIGKSNDPAWLNKIYEWNGAVKYGMTVLSPTTMARNFMSAYLFTLANGHFNLRPAMSALKTLRARDPQFRKYMLDLIDLGVLYDTANAGELRALLKDASLDGSALHENGAIQTAKEANKLMQFLYQSGDDFWKIIGFENEVNTLMRAKGYTREKAAPIAAKRVRDTYPTYSMVGKALQGLRKFPLAGSFVSFPAEIIRTRFNQMMYIAEDMADPDMRASAVKRLAGLVITTAAMATLSELSKAMFDISDDEEEAIRGLGAPWTENSQIFFMGRDDDGNARTLDLTFMDPYAYWSRPMVALWRDLPWEEKAYQSASELLSPFFGQDIAFGAVSEWWTNKKETGGQVYNPQESLQEQAADTVSHFTKSLAPGGVKWAIRALDAAQGKRAPSGKVYDIWDEGAAFLGFRFSTFDPKRNLFFKSYEFKDGLSNSNKILSDIAKDPNMVTEDDLRDGYRTAQKARERVFKDMRRYVDMARGMEISDSQIRQVLKSATISSRDIRALMSGDEIPKWNPGKNYLRNTIKRADALMGRDERVEMVKRLRAIRRIAREED